jgi:hypothetical protein
MNDSELDQRFREFREQIFRELDQFQEAVWDEVKRRNEHRWRGTALAITVGATVFSTLVGVGLAVAGLH